MLAKVKFLRKKKVAGSFLLDGLLAVLMIGMGAAAFFGLFPSFTHSQINSSDEGKANQMAQRMIEHLQLLKPADLNASTLSTINLIDDDQTESPFTFSEIPLDEATGYSPSRAMKNGQGEMEIEDLDANSKMVKITISWTTPKGKTRSFTTGTILGGYR